METWESAFPVEGGGAQPVAVALLPSSGARHRDPAEDAEPATGTGMLLLHLLAMPSQASVCRESKIKRE